MPDRATIKPKVMTVLAKRGRSPNSKQILNSKDEDTLLAGDLGMDETDRKLLSDPFSSISTAYSHGIPMAPSATGNLRTAKTAIDLVLARANGKKG